MEEITRLPSDVKGRKHYIRCEEAKAAYGEKSVGQDSHTSDEAVAAKTHIWRTDKVSPVDTIQGASVVFLQII